MPRIFAMCATTAYAIELLILVSRPPTLSGVILPATMVVVARVRVKICGVMRPEDAAAACRYGADAIGIAFQPGQKRNVSVARAREIVSVLTPFVTPVGVFVESTP